MVKIEARISKLSAPCMITDSKTLDPTIPNTMHLSSLFHLHAPCLVIAYIFHNLHVT